MKLSMDEHTLLLEKSGLQQKELEAEMMDINAEIFMKNSNIKDIQSQLKQMIVRAPVPGVVVEINGETGSMITKDNMLVKISDLRTYKITGKISDQFAEKIQIGGKVSIIIDKDHQLSGTIGNIRPLVQDGQVYFDIFPDDKSFARFRPNLKVEIRVEVARKENTLRVKDGPFFDGAKKLRVYRLKGQQAHAVEVSTDLVNRQYLEILEGLKEGDEIVISDVSLIKALDVVEIK